MFRIPNAKQFTVDNESMARGNVYETFNVMFDADKGRIKLNPPLLNALSTVDDMGFIAPTFIITTNSTTHGLDTYILTNLPGAGSSGVWSLINKAFIGTSNAPQNAGPLDSSMCMFNTYLCVSDEDGLHYVESQANLPAGVWVLNTTAALKHNYIMFQFVTGKMYFFSTYAIASADFTPPTTWTVATSGAYTQAINSFFGGITCACQGADTIWYATESYPYTKENKSYIYKWDGIAVNPIGKYLIPVRKIQAIVTLDNIPVAIDDRGRLWFYDGYTFKLKDGARIPAREDDFNAQTCYVHRNGMLSNKGKIYVLVGSGTATKNTTDRALSGIWCYDPAIGFYHYSSPDNCSQIITPYALALGQTENTFIAGVQTGLTSVTGVDRVSVTEQLDILTGTTRTGFITTQFLESKNLTDMFTNIGIKYRKMIDSGAKIEVKYRTWKNVECNGTITFTGATTFTVPTATLDGTSVYCTPVAIGDEMMVQSGANAGLIAHITNRVDSAGTSTITIDRNATLTSGTAYALFCNYILAGTITNDGDTLRSTAVGMPSTMLQVKVVLSWKGYYDELQEIMIPEKLNETTL